MRADGSHQFLEDGGPILGIFPAQDYDQFQTPFRDGDVIVIYSDGITESCSPADEEFDLERLADLVREHRARRCRRDCGCNPRARQGMDGRVPACRRHDTGRCAQNYRECV